VEARSSQPVEPATAGLLRTFSASLAALVAGLVLMLWTTEGGSAFTTETARRAAVERAPQPLPDLSVVGADGEVTTLGRLFASGGRVWIVDFVYTRCQAVCSALGSIYQQLQQRILDGDLKGRVGLLSISFDPASDDAAALRGYAARMRMDADVWRIVTLRSAADRRRLLDAFGIMVVPAPLGEFEHNAALHIVDGQGQLVHIVDYDSPAQALALARVLAL
jgi:protein SCO1/2